jgi:hypothetical protein
MKNKMPTLEVKDSFDRFLDNLSKMLRVPPLSFDGSGLCKVTLSEDCAVTIFRNDITGQIRLTSVVANSLPKNADQKLYLDIFSDGLVSIKFCQPGIVVNNAAKEVIVHQSFPVTELHDANLRKHFKGFLDFQAYWKNRLNTD